MSGKFESLKIKDVRKVTDQAISVSFDLAPEQENRFNRYKHGQYLTLDVHINGSDLRRSYSVSSSFHFNEPLTIAIKRVENGKVSNALNDELKPGDHLQVMPPQGGFTLDHAPDNTGAFVFFAGGSGITPIISLIKEILATRPGVQVYLMYGNRDVNNIIYREELERLNSDYPNLHITHVLEDTSGADFPCEKGLLDPDTCTDLLDRHQLTGNYNAYFICGPELMMDAVKEGLSRHNVPSECILIEYFTAPTAQPETETSGAPFSGEATVWVTLDGEEHKLQVPEKTTLLAAMLDAGLDAPFSCQGGVCSTCRALVTEGEVNLKQNFGISDSEVEQGFTLTCSTYPRSNVIRIDFDQA